MAATRYQAVPGITHATREELIALRRQLPRRLEAPMDRVHGPRAGTQSSVMRGRGMDYRESRAYQPGDDVRRLDWRLTARSGRLHTKLFQEEREKRLLVVLDTNASMQFGTRCRFKSAQAARAAALAVWLGVASDMQVGLALFGDRSVLVRPGAGARGALGVIQALGAAPPQPVRQAREPLSRALQRITRLARGGSQVVIISDGDSLDDDAAARLVALRRHAHVRILVVADALESELVPPGTYPLAWQDGVRSVALESRAARTRFRDALGRAPRRLQHLAGKLGLPCRRIDTAGEPLHAVAELMGITLGARGR
jgi:uncharacterized protein (DUF58 family)